MGEKRLQIEVELMPDEGAQFPDYREASAGCLKTLLTLLDGIAEDAKYLPGLDSVWVTVGEPDFQKLYNRVGEIHGAVDRHVYDYLRDVYRREDGIHAVFHIWEHAYLIQRQSLKQII